MECTKCKKNLGKVTGRLITLSNGVTITGLNYDVIVKCECGELVTASCVDGIIKADEQKTNEPVNNEPVNNGEPTGEPSQPTGEPTGEPSDPGVTTNTPLPARPKSWLSGK